MEAIFRNYCLIEQDGTTPRNTAEMINGVPVFRAVIGWPKGSSWEEKAKNAANTIRRYTAKTRPAFLHCSLANWGGKDVEWKLWAREEMETMRMIQMITENLPSEYVPVRDDHLVELYKMYRTLNPDIEAREEVVRPTGIEASAELWVRQLEPKTVYESDVISVWSTSNKNPKLP